MEPITQLRPIFIQLGKKPRRSPDDSNVPSVVVRFNSHPFGNVIGFLRKVEVFAYSPRGGDELHTRDLGEYIIFSETRTQFPGDDLVDYVISCRPLDANEALKKLHFNVMADGRENPTGLFTCGEL